MSWKRGRVTSSFYFSVALFFNSPFSYTKCHELRPYVMLQVGHFQQAKFGFLPFFFFIPVQFQRKIAPVFEQAKTSGCTVANHVISERIYPNKAWSNTGPLWLPNGLCIIRLDPYNNTGSLGAILRFPRFPCRDTALSGFSLSTDVTCTNKQTQLSSSLY